MTHSQIARDALSLCVAAAWLHENQRQAEGAVMRDLAFSAISRASAILVQSSGSINSLVFDIVSSEGSSAHSTMNDHGPSESPGCPQGIDSIAKEMELILRLPLHLMKTQQALEVVSVALHSCKEVLESGQPVAAEAVDGSDIAATPRENAPNFGLVGSCLSACARLLYGLRPDRAAELVGITAEHPIGAASTQAASTHAPGARRRSQGGRSERLESLTDGLIRSVLEMLRLAATPGWMAQASGLGRPAAATTVGPGVSSALASDTASVCSAVAVADGLCLLAFATCHCDLTQISMAPHGQEIADLARKLTGWRDLCDSYVKEVGPEGDDYDGLQPVAPSDERLPVELWDRQLGGHEARDAASDGTAVGGGPTPSYRSEMLFDSALWYFEELRHLRTEPRRPWTIGVSLTTVRRQARALHSVACSPNVTVHAAAQALEAAVGGMLSLYCGPVETTSEAGSDQAGSAASASTSGGHRTSERLGSYAALQGPAAPEEFVSQLNRLFRMDVAACMEMSISEEQAPLLAIEAKIWSLYALTDCVRAAETLLKAGADTSTRGLLGRFAVGTKSAISLSLGSTSPVDELGLAHVSGSGSSLSSAASPARTESHHENGTFAMVSTLLAASLLHDFQLNVSEVLLHSYTSTIQRFWELHCDWERQQQTEASTMLNRFAAAELCQKRWGHAGEPSEESLPQAFAGSGGSSAAAADKSQARPDKPKASPRSAPAQASPFGSLGSLAGKPRRVSAKSNAKPGLEVAAVGEGTNGYSLLIPAAWKLPKPDESRRRLSPASTGCLLLQACRRVTLCCSKQAGRVFAETVSLVRRLVQIEAGAKGVVDLPLVTEAAMFFAEAACVALRRKVPDQLLRQGNSYPTTTMHPALMSHQRSYPGDSLAGRCFATSVSGLSQCADVVGSVVFGSNEPSEVGKMPPNETAFQVQAALLEATLLVWQDSPRLLPSDAVRAALAPMASGAEGLKKQAGGRMLRAGSDSDESGSDGGTEPPPLVFKAADDGGGRYDRVAAMVAGWLGIGQREQVVWAVQATSRNMVGLSQRTVPSPPTSGPHPKYDLIRGLSRFVEVASALAQRFAVFLHREITAGIGMLKQRPERDCLPGAVQAVRELADELLRLLRPAASGASSSSGKADIHGKPLACTPATSSALASTLDVLRRASEASASWPKRRGRIRARLQSPAELRTGSDTPRSESRVEGVGRQAASGAGDTGTERAPAASGRGRGSSRRGRGRARGGAARMKRMRRSRAAGLTSNHTVRQWILEDEGGDWESDDDFGDLDDFIADG